MFEKTAGPWALMEAAASTSGPPFDWPRLVSGCRDLLQRIAYAQQRLPEPFLDAILELGDGMVLGSLAANADALEAHPGLRARLAATGARQIAAVAEYQPYKPDPWGIGLRRTVFARLVEPPVSNPSSDRAAVAAPYPAVVRAVLNTVRSKLTPAEQLRGILTLRRMEGLDTPLPHGLVAVPDGPIEGLEALLAASEGTSGAIEELRSGFTGNLPLREELDWAAVAAATPFGAAAAAALAGRTDCPEELRHALFLAEPAAVAPAVPRLTEAMALAAVPKKVLRVVAKRAVADGLDPELLLERMRPAAAVLEFVRLDELAKLVDTHLGADPWRWGWVRSKVGSFPGSVTALLTAAGRVAFLAKATGGRPAFLGLLNHATTETQLALLEHLDDGTVTDLFTQGDWRAEWVERALTDPRPALRLALASRPSLDAASAERLATLDDPVVNGKLFRRTGTSHRLRMELLDGRPFDPAARQELFKLNAGFHGTDPLKCADLALQRHLLRHVRVRGKTAQFRLLLNLWHRHGPAAVTGLLEAELKPVGFSAAVIAVPVRSRMTKLLAVPDETARQERFDALEAEVALAESAEGQLALLRSDTVDADTLGRDTRLWHWDAILAAHRRDPLPGRGLVAIREQRGCPAELVAAGAGILRPWASAVDAELAAGRPPEEVLAAPRTGHYDGWLWRATESGAVTWEQVLWHARPVDKVLELIGGDSSSPAARAALARLLGEVWDGNVDAIVLAVRMAGDFPGSVAELLQVATAAAA
ncbi:hypothetical protein [Dactylosporangium sp. NPDC051541]|uniref:hypothetical protein n=1 Tax=Dactylosporangium sp. NPDC051541 TaxID=3363977 RepID=UPI00378E218D